MNTFNSRAYHSRIPGESILDRDDESDRAILEEDEGKGPGIMKTTQVTVVEQSGDSSSDHIESQGSYKQSNDWAQGGHHAR